MATPVFTMPSTESVLVIALSGILLLSYVHRVVQWRRRSRGLPLPPGPSALPIVGNLYTAPNFKSWEGYQDLCDKYGEHHNQCLPHLAPDSNLLHAYCDTRLGTV